MQLSKHHGLGNDFLVLVDLDGRVRVDADLARRLCDRRRGVGADGLLHVGPGREGADVSMTLRNADGGLAEMSGNGIRCVAQAVARARGAASLELDVATDAGLRHVSVRPGSEPSSAQVRVDMGAVTPADVGLRIAGAKDVAGASVGNPHEVALFADRDELDAAADGFAATDRNVEFVVLGPGDDTITMRVVERGVGETLACGTGACAAAWVVRRWGLVGDVVTVRMPGGDAVVELGDTVRLSGPAVHVVDIDVDLGEGGPWR